MTSFGLGAGVRGRGRSAAGSPSGTAAATPDAPRCAGDAGSLREGFAQREAARGAAALAPKTADAALSLHPAMSRHQRCIDGQTASEGPRSTVDLLKGVSDLNTPPRPTLPATASVSPDSCLTLSELSSHGLHPGLLCRPGCGYPRRFGQTVSIFRYEWEMHPRGQTLP